jgi:hypothetical protein
MDNSLSPSHTLIPCDGYSLVPPVGVDSPPPLQADQTVADSDCFANAVQSGASHFGSAQPQGLQPDEVRL